MSADNWATCPKCGKEECLREDYEIGFWRGKFEIDYHAKCYYGREDGCGYVFKYKHSEPAPTPLSACE